MKTLTNSGQTTATEQLVKDPEKQFPDIHHKDTLLKIWQTIKENPNIRHHTLSKLARQNNLHQKTLGRKFIIMFGVSISRFIRDECMRKSYMLVTTTTIPIEDISFELGYSEPTNFNRAFKLKFKVSPQSLRSSIQMNIHKKLSPNDSKMSSND